MTNAGSLYGRSLYELAAEEGLEDQIGLLGTGPVPDLIGVKIGFKKIHGPLLQL